ncbi:MAG: DUF1566 domain-containing protein [Deltaproteobacteria bacterium]|nr:DUF1566 domain-containing protein [Deltaproteobacteria bacterium]
MKGGALSLLAGWIGLVTLGMCACGGTDKEEAEVKSISFNGTLFVAPSDSIEGANTVWGLQGTAIGAVSTADGAANTVLAVDNMGDIGTEFAAKICSELLSHDFDDWYLPSSEELNALYSNRDAIDNLEAQWYWSSTEADADDAWLQNFADGFSHSASKGLLARVRCVRRDP